MRRKRSKVCSGFCWTCSRCPDSTIEDRCTCLEAPCEEHEDERDHGDTWDELSEATWNQRHQIALEDPMNPDLRAMVRLSREP